MNPFPRAHSALNYERVDDALGLRWRVSDPTQGTVFWFSDQAFRVLESLNGERSPEAVAAHVGALDDDARRSVDGLIVAFGRAGLLASRRTNQRSFQRVQLWQQDVRNASGQLETEALSDVLDEVLRAKNAVTHDCAACKLTCCDYVIDVEQSEASALIDAAAALTDPIPRDALFAVERPPGGAAFVLGRSATTGGCIAIDCAGRCRIHAELGAARKPGACQFFPTLLTLRPDGARVAARGGCAHPGTTTDSAQVAEHQAMLRRVAVTSPSIVVRRAPTEPVLMGTLAFPWSTWVRWEGEALARLATTSDASDANDANDANSALGEVVALLRDIAVPADACSGEVVPPTDDHAARSLVAALSQLVRETRGADLDADALLAFASAEPSDPPKDQGFAKPAFVAQWIEGLEPLKYPSALAGLGVLRMILGAVDHHAWGREEPEEAKASLIRSLHAARVSVALGRANVAVLEALTSL